MFAIFTACNVRFLFTGNFWLEAVPVFNDVSNNGAADTLKRLQARQVTRILFKGLFATETGKQVLRGARSFWMRHRVIGAGTQEEDAVKVDFSGQSQLVEGAQGPCIFH